MVRQVNKKDKFPRSLVFDEFPTIFFNHMDSVIATARSNKVATILAMQDFSQLRKDYGKEQADVIINITGNIICGQLIGDTAKTISERFGKIAQEKESISINRMDTSVTYSVQLDYAVPASKISLLSSGEFVGMVADDPTNKIKFKAFHSEIINNANKLNKELNNYITIPSIQDISHQQIMENYHQVKVDIMQIIESKIEELKMSE